MNGSRQEPGTKNGLTNSQFSESFFTILSAPDTNSICQNLERLLNSWLLRGNLEPNCGVTLLVPVKKTGITFRLLRAGMIKVNLGVLYQLKL